MSMSKDTVLQKEVKLLSVTISLKYLTSPSSQFARLEPRTLD